MEFISIYYFASAFDHSMLCLWNLVTLSSVVVDGYFSLLYSFPLYTYKIIYQKAYIVY